MESVNLIKVYQSVPTMKAMAGDGIISKVSDFKVARFLAKSNAVDAPNQPNEINVINRMKSTFRYVKVRPPPVLHLPKCATSSSPFYSSLNFTGRLN